MTLGQKSWPLSELNSNENPSEKDRLPCDKSL